MMLSELEDFGYRYAKAWCSQTPERVSSFFAQDGSLRVNGGAPAVGRAAIAEVAQGFMTAFPDMIVTMDSLSYGSKSMEFHWTLTGTNTGPEGTGHKVCISGYEAWQMAPTGLIAESKGHFDAAEYQRQLEVGCDG